MDRRRAISLAAVAAVLLVVAVTLLSRSPSRPDNCDDVRLASARANQLAAPGRRPPTSADYRVQAEAVRRVALASPSAVRPHVDAMADALGLLATDVRGFDPADSATFTVLEQRTAEIEQAQSQLDDATAGIDAWVGRVCT